MKKKILFIDDKRELRTLLGLIFEKEYEVATSENGADAFRQLQDGYRPDLIVSDLMMPGVGGKLFLSQLKSNTFYSEIPVIILSSIDKSEERIDLLQMGAVDYLVKPFNPQELLVRIRRVLSEN